MEITNTYVKYFFNAQNILHTRTFVRVENQTTTRIYKFLKKERKQEQEV